MEKMTHEEHMEHMKHFFNWMLEYGYLEPEDIEEDGEEFSKDLEKILEVAPRFYGFIMSMCYA